MFEADISLVSEPTVAPAANVEKSDDMKFAAGSNEPIGGGKIFGGGVEHMRFGLGLVAESEGVLGPS